MPACTDCPLHMTCRTPEIPALVPQGSEPVDILFVGTSPGAEEDSLGQPYVGPQGRFLKDILSTGSYRVALTYAVRCRPRNQEPPTKEQTSSCRRHLLDDIEKLQPRILVALGAEAYYALTGKAAQVGRLLARPEKLGERWLLTTYSPALHLSGRRDLIPVYTNLLVTINSIMETGDISESRPPDIRIVDQSTISAMLSQIAMSRYLSFDVETNCTDKDPEAATIFLPGRKLLCIGIATDPRMPVWVVPPAFYNYLHPYFTDGRRILIGHNVVYDLIALAWFLGWHDILDQPRHCTFLMHSSMDRGAIGNGLEDCAVRYLAVPPWKHRIKDLVEEVRSQRVKARLPGHPTFEDVPFQALAQYNGRDALHTLMLFHVFKEWKIPAVYRTLHLPGIALLAKLSLRGMAGDSRYVEWARRCTEKTADFLQETLHRSFAVRRLEAEQGAPLNVKSPQQASRLVELCGLVGEVPDTKTGLHSTSKEALGVLARKNPMWARYSRVRKLRDMVSKFLEPLKTHLLSRDGRIHPTYHGAKMSSTSNEGESGSGGAQTGRLSCSQPNLQQIQKEKLIRRIFVAPHGKYLAELDFSGAEVRVMAWLSGAKKLINWFKKGVDPYVELAMMVWGYKREEVTKQIRQEAKTAFLARMYGQGLDGFVRRNKASYEKARQFFDFFNKNFPEIIALQRSLVKRVERGEMITTPWGDQRKFNLEGKDTFNALINDPVQGSSSNLLYWKALATEKEQSEDSFRIICLVHDSMIAEVDCENAEEILTKQVHIMTRVDDLPFDFPFPCPLEVSVKVGRNMGDTISWAPGQTINIPLPA